MRTERDRPSASNERVKLLAGFMNAPGLDLIGFAVLRPLTDMPVAVTLTSVWWGLTGAHDMGLRRIF